MSLEAYASLLGAGLAMAFGAIGPGVGEGIAAREAVRGMARQPAMSGPLLKSMLIGQAVSETSGIFALFVALLILFAGGASESWARAAAIVGAGIAVGVGGVGSGLATGQVAGDACQAMARAPRKAPRLTLSMLITQGLTQTPGVFGLLVAVLLLLQGASSLAPPEELAAAIKHLAAGLCMGIGALGPALGMGLVGSSFCRASGRYPEGHAPAMRAMLVGGAVTQTTSIYALCIALLMLLR